MAERLAANLFERLYLYYGGRPQLGYGTKLYVTDPASEKTVGWCVTGNMEDTERAVGCARDAFDHGPWPAMPVSERADHLLRLADLYEHAAPQMAVLVRAQTGCPIRYVGQTDDPADILRYTALSLGDASSLFGHTYRGLLPYRLVREPVGVVAVIVDSPMPQKALMAKVAPALLAGCAVIVQPSPHSPLDAMHLADLCHAAGLPPGVLNVVPRPYFPPAMEHLVEHQGVDMVAYTGDPFIGRRVAQLCAEHFKRLALQCGGKNAAIVRADADLEHATASIIALALGASGQIGANLSRVIADKRVVDELTERLRTAFDRLHVGDPADVATEVGPVASKHVLGNVLDEIARAREDGARLVCGGGRVDRPGWFVQPTLFADVAPACTLAKRAVPGPVMAVHAYTDDAEAVTIANGTPYGQAVAIYGGGDPTTVNGGVEWMAKAVRAGTVHLDGQPAPIHAPQGGFKASSIGRELGADGLSAFQEVKVIAGLLPPR